MFTKPGEFQFNKCHVCSAKMNVRRNCFGPTCFAAAVGGRKYWRHHDHWTCPHCGADWHEQARQIMALIEQTPSQIIRELLERELTEILRTQRATV